MTVEIEIKVGSDEHKMPGMEMPAEPKMSKDQLQAVLKGLLEKTDIKNPAEHQAKIDEITKKLEDLSEEEED
jgi:hypothetical protein